MARKVTSQSFLHSMIRLLSTDQEMIPTRCGINLNSHCTLAHHAIRNGYQYARSSRTVSILPIAMLQSPTPDPRTIDSIRPHRARHLQPDGDQSRDPWCVIQGFSLPLPNCLAQYCTLKWSITTSFTFITNYNLW